jgi:hypothetical protein
MIPRHMHAVAKLCYAKPEKRTTIQGTERNKDEFERNSPIRARAQKKALGTAGIQAAAMVERSQKKGKKRRRKETFWKAPVLMDDAPDA